MPHSSNHHRPSAAALAIAQAILPPGPTFLPGMTAARLAEIYSETQLVAGAMPTIMDGICRALDLLAVAHTGTRFSNLEPARRQALICRWNESPGPACSMLALVSTMLKLHYFDDEQIHRGYGVPYDKSPEHPEPEPRYMQEQVIRGADLEQDEELEADIVVAGSGAAGAYVAKELAERGHAVLLVEEGRYFKREDFTGRFLPASQNFYHWRTRNHVVGNCLINLPTGRTVGGSTTINTATSFRPPAWVHRRWVEEMGLPELSLEQMTPIFDEVEASMRMEPAPRELWGGHVELMNALLDAKGIAHAPIRRNAPDCDGQSTCDMGCPSGGKYSMDRSMVPMALRHGAFLLTETSLQQVHINASRKVTGATLVSGGKRLHVKARHVALACGALATPEIMWRHGLGGEAVGRFLTIQPSASVMARLPNEVNGHMVVIPSSHYISEHQEQRRMYMSANLPVDMASMPLQLVGHELMETMEGLSHLGNWGVLLAERTYSRLRRLPGGDIATTYFMNRQDARSLRDGLAFLGGLYFDAGATALFPAVHGFPVIRHRDDLARFARTRFKPSQFLMTAYHACGSCRMGRDPRTSVVDPDYAVRGVEGLSIVDGSVVPGPLGINSQETIMGFALRSVPFLHRTLEQGA